MKRFFGLTIVLVVIALLANVPVADAAAKKIKVAVIDFENNSTWHYWGDRLGQAAGHEFVTQLLATNQFTIIEREKLQSVLAEQSLGASGAVTPSSAAKIGKLLGVQLLFTGSITAFSIKKTGGSFMGVSAASGKAESKLDVRMIDTTTGEILLAVDGKGDKKMGGVGFRGTSFEQDYDQGVASEALRPAVQEVTRKIVANIDKLAALAPVAGAGKILDVKDDGSKIYIEGGADNGVNVGDVYTVYRVTDEIKDEDGNVLDRIEGKIGEIVVTTVNPRSAIAQKRSGDVKKGDSYRKE
jgi:curli biogenesis system outer membrane secretion channel CsgG